MRRLVQVVGVLVVGVLGVVVLVVLPLASLAGPAGAATDVTAPPTTTPVSALPIPSGIELPNSGTAPEFSGDRGGWAQITLFAVMSVAIVLIFVRIAYATRQRTKTRTTRLAGGPNA